MPIERRIDHERQLVLGTWSGIIGMPQLRDALERLIADEALMAVGRSLTDLRDVQFSISTADIRDSELGIIAPRLGAKKWRIAMLVRDELQYGICRQFLSLTSAHVTGEVFTVESDALAWVLGDS